MSKEGGIIIHSESFAYAQPELDFIINQSMPHPPLQSTESDWPREFDDELILFLISEQSILF